MVGKSPTTAAPTVMSISENSDYRKEARKAIKENGILSQYAGFKTAHIAGDSGFQRIEQLARGEKFEIEPPGANIATEVLFDSSKAFRTLGLPIYVRHSSSIRTATANAVKIGDRVFFQTVYHAFHEESSQSEKPALSYDDDFEIDSDSDPENEDDDEANVVITSIASQSPEAWSESGDSETGSSRHSFTFSARAMPRLEEVGLLEDVNSSSSLDGAATQLAPFALTRPVYSLEERPQPSKDALSPIGKLFKWSVDKDWALVEITDANVQEFLRAILSNKDSTILNFETAAQTPKDGAEVITSTASNENLTAVLSGTPSCTRLPYSTSFQEAYTVRFNGPLADGDSGSAIKDATTGVLYGHIIAGCRITGSAYILAAYQVALDFQKISTMSLSEYVLEKGEHQEIPTDEATPSPSRSRRTSLSEYSRANHRP